MAIFLSLALYHFTPVPKAFKCQGARRCGHVTKKVRVKSEEICLYFCKKERSSCDGVFFSPVENLCRLLTAETSMGNSECVDNEDMYYQLD